MIPREVLRQVRRIEIRTRRLVNDVFGGEYHSAFKGAGLSFEEVREYQPGDDVRTIDWNVTDRDVRRGARSARRCSPARSSSIGSNEVFLAKAQRTQRRTKEGQRRP